MPITENELKDLLNSKNIKEQFNFLPGFLDWIKRKKGIYHIYSKLQLKQKQMEGGNKNSKKKKKRKKGKSTKLSKKGGANDEGWIDSSIPFFIVLAAFFYAVKGCKDLLVDLFLPPDIEFAEEPMPVRANRPVRTSAREAWGIQQIQNSEF